MLNIIDPNSSMYNKQRAALLLNPAEIPPKPHSFPIKFHSYRVFGFFHLLITSLKIVLKAL